MFHSRAPYLLKMESIAKCMECSLPFSMMRKKYHCKACGIGNKNTCLIPLNHMFTNTTCSIFSRLLQMLQPEIPTEFRGEQIVSGVPVLPRITRLPAEPTLERGHGSGSVTIFYANITRTGHKCYLYKSDFRLNCSKNSTVGR